MRINKTITNGKILWSLVNFSQLIILFKEVYEDQSSGASQRHFEQNMMKNNPYDKWLFQEDRNQSSKTNLQHI